MVRLLVAIAALPLLAVPPVRAEPPPPPPDTAHAVTFVRADTGDAFTLARQDGLWRLETEAGALLLLDPDTGHAVVIEGDTGFRTVLGADFMPGLDPVAVMAGLVDAPDWQALEQTHVADAACRLYQATGRAPAGHRVTGRFCVTEDGIPLQAEIDPGLGGAVQRVDARALDRGPFPAADFDLSVHDSLPIMPSGD